MPESPGLLENDIDVLVPGAAAQQQHVRTLQPIEQRKPRPRHIPAQDMFVTVGCDEDLFASTTPDFSSMSAENRDTVATLRARLPTHGSKPQ
jgi:hypothetical protein